MNIGRNIFIFYSHKDYSMLLLLKGDAFVVALNEGPVFLHVNTMQIKL
jgi:hypothetical protein